MSRLPKHSFRFTAACALAVLGLTAAASAPLNTASAQQRECFRAMDWHDSAAGGPHDLYIRVGMHDVWHLGMAQSCPGAAFPGAVRISDLVTNINEICSAVDLQITVAPQGTSHSTPCIVTSMNKLSPDEVKALPRKAVP